MKKFNEWLESLNETVSFQVSGIDKSQEDADLHFLCYHLKDKIYSMFSKEFEAAGFDKYNSDLIEPDGDFYGEERKEEINFYSGMIPEEYRDKMLKALLYLLPEFRMKQNGPVRKDVSRLKKVEVHRIPVSVTPVDDPAPQINIADANAAEIFKLLGMRKEGWGEINVADLNIRLAKITDFEKQMALRADQSADQSFGRMVSFGLTEERLEHYLQMLEKMAAWALKHGYDTISYN
jgi:hypothetical protein